MTNQQTVSIDFAGGSDKGRVREQNEDSILCHCVADSDVCLLVVADGVGGHAGGAEASKLAVSSMKDSIEKAVMQAQSGGGYAQNWLELTLQQAIVEANAAIVQHQQQDPALQNMASTVVALLCKGSDVMLGHLGDSRCYLSTPDVLQQLTDDHTIMQDLLNEGRIKQKDFDLIPLHHVISRALGIAEHPVVEVHSYKLLDGQTFLLCSDGLTNLASDKQIQQLIQQHDELQTCVDELITLANDLGGVDNISVVLLRKSA